MSSILKKKLKIPAAIIALILVIAWIGTYSLELWTKNIVEENARLTYETVQRITLASERMIDTLSRDGFFSRKELTPGEHRFFDSLFATIVSSEAVSVNGMEGGFYIKHLRSMIGYSWPTCPPPPPAFGPAPRSYQIILEQLVSTVQSDSSFLEFHQFDFATFPLATVPVRFNNKVVGAAWARIHVERELPSSRIGRWLNIVLVLIVSAFFLLFFFSWYQRKEVDEIRKALSLITTDPSHRLEPHRGVFGSISASINALIDTQQQQEERRDQLERQLHQQDKMATLGKLVAGVAHEVKTPLAAIKTRIQMWQRDLKQFGSSAPAGSVITEESLEMMVKEINRLSQLVKRLLVFSKPFGPQMKQADLVQLIRQTIPILEESANKSGVEIQIYFPQKLPKAACDSNSLEQVILNICGNAIEAMPNGGVLTVTGTSAGNEAEIELQISDTGSGIDAAIRDHIFEPFFTTKEQGAGLGLYISGEIVRAHGGSISFEPVNPSGTRCILRLPLKQEQKARKS